MKIKMKTLSAGPEGVMQPGQVYEVDAAEAQALIDGRYAVSMEPVKSTEPKPEVPEGLIAHNGGWYELPNGNKVQGLEKAIQALADFREADQKAAEAAEILRKKQEEEAEALRKQLEKEEAEKSQQPPTDEN